METLFAFNLLWRNIKYRKRVDVLFCLNIKAPLAAGCENFSSHSGRIRLIFLGDVTQFLARICMAERLRSESTVSIN
jgi:hypothetical protein